MWAGARAIGTAHLAQGLPCQDAFVCRIWQEGAHPPVLIAALADGAGSAERAEVGAQLATSLVADIVGEQLAEGIAPDQVANVLRYAIGEARLALELQAGHAGRVIDDYACTLLVAILSVDGGIVGQIGDGAVVIDDGEQRLAPGALAGPWRVRQHHAFPDRARRARCPAACHARSAGAAGVPVLGRPRAAGARLPRPLGPCPLLRCHLPAYRAARSKPGMPHTFRASSRLCSAPTRSTAARTTTSRCSVPPCSPA